LLSGYYFDKIPTGFLAWSQTIKGYRPVTSDGSPFEWDALSRPALNILESTLFQPEYFKKIILLWSQETGKGSGSLEVRSENVCLIKSSGQ
jgi:proteasome activator subunit 4